jgi:SOS response regulatory protein OraA/RecX
MSYSESDGAPRHKKAKEASLTKKISKTSKIDVSATKLNSLIGDTNKVLNTWLKQKGIEDHFIIKVKEIKNKNWLGLYRSLSQFTSRPIFWINSRLYEILKEKGIPEREDLNIMSQTAAHEYGHVIAEWALKRNPELNRLIKSEWTDEEDFAERFKDFLIGEDDNPAFDKVLELYKKDLQTSH